MPAITGACCYGRYGEEGWGNTTKPLSHIDEIHVIVNTGIEPADIVTVDTYNAKVIRNTNLAVASDTGSRTSPDSV